MNKINIILFSIFISILIWGAILIRSLTNVGNVPIIQDDNRKDWVEDSISISRINSISEATIKEFMKYNTKDSIINELISVVNKYQKELKKGGSITRFQTNTIISDSSKTYITYQDTIFRDKVAYIYPTYKTKFNTKWYKGTVRANNKTINLDSFSFTNSYNVIFGKEKVGLFKTKSFVQIDNLNPYSSTGQLKSYITEGKDKKFVLGPSIFVGANEDGMTYGAGISLTYKIFEF